MEEEGKGMIIGTIDTMMPEKLSYPAAIWEALEYLSSQDFTKMSDGKYSFGDKGMTATLQRYMTRPSEECRPEAHEKFIDIQFMVDGEEFLGWCPLSPDLVVHESYDKEKDVVFYESLIPDSSVVLFPGSFAVLYPGDVHRPCCALDEPEQVVKVVVKVPVELVL